MAHFAVVASSSKRARFGDGLEGAHGGGVGGSNDDGAATL